MDCDKPPAQPCVPDLVPACSEGRGMPPDVGAVDCMGGRSVASVEPGKYLRIRSGPKFGVHQVSSPGIPACFPQVGTEKTPVIGSRKPGIPLLSDKLEGGGTQLLPVIMCAF